MLQWVAFCFSRGSSQYQGLNPSLPHCRQILHQLSYKGSPAMQETQFLGQGRFPWRSKWQPTPVFFPGKSHRQRSLTVHGVARVGHDLWTKPSPIWNSERLNNLSLSLFVCLFLLLLQSLFILSWLHWVFVAAHGLSLAVASGS